MITIPQNRRWKQTNASDVFGSIFSSYNVNFDKEGYLQLSPKTVSLYSEDDDSDFGLPLAIFPLADLAGYFILTSGDPFSLTANASVAKIAGAPNDITLNSDAIPWQNKAYVTTDDDLVSWDTSSWTTGLKTLTASVPHPLAVMGNFAGGYLAVGNGNTVLLLDTSHNTVATLTLNSSYRVTCLKYQQGTLFIGTRSLDGQEAKVFTWNGAGTSAQNEYGVGASEVFAIEEYKGGIICVTSEGQLKQFSGGGFVPVANFPVWYSDYRWLDGLNDSPRVHRRGLKSDGDLIYINIDGTVSNRDSFFYLPEQPSGVWCYDPEVGLYCRHLSTSDQLLSLTASSLVNNILTLSSSTKLSTGEPVLVTNAGSLTGITARQTYYAIVVSETQIKLAATPYDAKSGTNISIGGSVSGAGFKVVGYNDYGQRSLQTGSVGAVGVVDRGIGTYSGSIFQELIPTTLLWGVEMGTTAHLNCLSSASNIGGFTTNKVWSNQTSDNFQKLLVKYADLNLDDEKITVRQLAKSRFGLPTESVSGTFSTNRVIGSDSPRIGAIEAGNTIHLVTGNGSPMAITVKEVSGDEFELSEVVPSASSADPVEFYGDNFEEVGQITDTDKNHQTIGLLDGQSSWSQFSLELRGQSIKIEELQLVQATHTQTK